MVKYLRLKHLFKLKISKGFGPLRAPFETGPDFQFGNIQKTETGLFNLVQVHPVLFQFRLETDLHLGLGLHDFGQPPQIKDLSLPKKRSGLATNSQ